MLNTKTYDVAILLTCKTMAFKSNTLLIFDRFLRRHTWGACRLYVRSVRYWIIYVQRILTYFVELHKWTLDTWRRSEWRSAWLRYRTILGGHHSWIRVYVFLCDKKILIFDTIKRLPWNYLVWFTNTWRRTSRCSRQLCISCKFTRTVKFFVLLLRHRLGWSFRRDLTIFTLLKYKYQAETQ